MDLTKAQPKSQKTQAKNQAPKAHGVGRRKSSVARAWLRRGEGKLVVNGKDYNTYFDTEVARLKAHTPFKVVPVAVQYDLEVNVCGGGLSAQSDAVKLAVARALLATDAELKPLLRQNGLLTVDSRLKERKKYGQRGARRKFQFVKR